MDAKIRSKIIETIREVEEHLIAHEYADIGSGSPIDGLNANEIRLALNAYGGKLTRAPERALNNLEYCCVEEGPPWYADFVLWINGEPSDLHVLITIDIHLNGELAAYIDELKVA